MTSYPEARVRLTSWVLVNGVPVIAEGRATGALLGRVLRGAGYRAP